MSTSTETDSLKARAQALVKALMEKANGGKGYHPREIEAKIEGRVSSRTLYRWAAGDSGPQQQKDVDALEALARAEGVAPA